MDDFTAMYPESLFARLRDQVDQAIEDGVPLVFKATLYDTEAVVIALAGTQYAAWRARIKTRCEVKVTRNLGPPQAKHWFLSSVEMTRVPAPLQ